MKFKGTITKLEDVGEDVRVFLTNVQRKGSASWREYGSEVSFRMPHEMAKRYHVGRSVTITMSIDK